MTTADQPVGEDFVTDYRPVTHLLRFDVFGTPQQQGSKNVGRWGGVYDDNADLPLWRALVHAEAAYALPHGWTALDRPLSVDLAFFMPRPHGHYGTGRNVTQIRESARRLPSVKPDIDKLIRAVLDSCTTAGVWTDDSRVVSISACKLYADHRAPGACITISEARA